MYTVHSESIICVCVGIKKLAKHKYDLRRIIDMNNENTTIGRSEVSTPQKKKKKLRQPHSERF